VLSLRREARQGAAFRAPPRQSPWEAASADQAAAPAAGRWLL